MQGSCNKIYNNRHGIIGWYPNKGKKNVEKTTVVKTDASGGGTEGESMLEG